MSGKWRILGVLALAQALAMSLWLSMNAVTPQLIAEFNLTPSQSGLLTLAVQLGFVAGTLTSALTNLADRWPTHVFITASCLLAALFTLASAYSPGYDWGLVALRFGVGFALAGVYPPGMKLVASWCVTDRGLGIGILVGALTLGKALPQLMSAYDLGMPPWRDVILMTAAGGALAAILVALFVRPGPHLLPATAFHWRHAVAALSDRPTRLANFGYFGHMWELYAMWTWVPAMLLASFAAADLSLSGARWAAFIALASGAAGCVVAGQLADRLGRTTITIAAMAISGACCVLAGLTFGHPFVLLGICIVWGITVVADSAQFSAAVSELADKRYVGTALTMQTCIGFLLTTITIGLVPVLVETLTWRYAMAFLAIGPILGIVAMARLRGLPEASKLAHGRR